MRPLRVHLVELCKRLLVGALAVLACACLCWALRFRILAWLLEPYEKAWNARFTDPPELLSLAPVDTLLSSLKLAFVSGVVCAMPVLFYELWAFMGPRLGGHKRRLLMPFVLLSTVFFWSGVAVAHYVATPYMLGRFFSLLAPATEHGATFAQTPTLEGYVDFSIRTTLVFGAVFEAPLFLTFIVLGSIRRRPLGAGQRPC